MPDNLKETILEQLQKRKDELQAGNKLSEYIFIIISIMKILFSILFPLKITKLYLCLVIKNFFVM